MSQTEYNNKCKEILQLCIDNVVDIIELSRLYDARVIVSAKMLKRGKKDIPENHLTWLRSCIDKYLSLKRHEGTTKNKTKVNSHTKSINKYQ